VLFAIVLAGAGISVVVGGAFIQGMNSVATGVTIGVILFCAIAIVAPVVMWLKRTGKLAAPVGEEARDGALTSLDKLLGSSE